MTRAALAFVSIASVLLAGCGGRLPQPFVARASTPPNTATTRAALDSGIVTPAEIALGDSVFNDVDGAGICATCHGRDGAGTGAAPSLRDQQWINGDGSIGFIKGTVYQGVPHPLQHPLPMPPFGHTLTDRQLQAVAAYVYALSHRPSR